MESAPQRILLTGRLRWEDGLQCSADEALADETCVAATRPSSMGTTIIMVLPYKLRTGLNSTRDEKVDKKSDRGGSREQF